MKGGKKKKKRHLEKLQIFLTLTLHDYFGSLARFQQNVMKTIKKGEQVDSWSRTEKEKKIIPLPMLKLSIEISVQSELAGGCVKTWSLSLTAEGMRYLSQRQSTA